MKVCHACNIVHDEKSCPLCDAKEKIESLEKELEIANRSQKSNRSE